MAHDTATHRPDGIEVRSGDTLLVTGKGRLWTFPLVAPAVVIGRDPSCEVVIDDPVLSRRHARLALGPPSTIEDLGSHNGTKIEQRVHRGGGPLQLAPGAGFTIGSYTFIVVSASAHPSTQRSALEQLLVADPARCGDSSLIVDIARRGLNVLILGESGVGKDVLATRLHELSGRAGPLQRINCAALPEALLEGELFGHERGAFTGAAGQRIGLLETAAGGTVFLDEIGELPLAIQAKLLRAIEAREIVRLGANRVTTIDVRFLFATHRELAREVAEQRFRHDLYYRIDGITLRIPPLRERPGQIGRLALELLGAQGHAHALAPEVLARLQAHAWPGNVRELKAVLERAVLLARGGPIAAGHLAFSSTPTTAAAPAPPPAAGSPPRSSAGAIDDLTPDQRAERDRIISTLDSCAGNQTRAAALLGISRTTLVTKIRVYRIQRPRS